MAQVKAEHAIAAAVVIIGAVVYFMQDEPQTPPPDPALEEARRVLAEAPPVAEETEEFDTTSCIELASVWNLTAPDQIQTGHLCASELNPEASAFLRCLSTAANEAAVLGCRELKPAGL